ncbi:response regulator [Trueperella sp.]|uniref:response regulator n=1 Tax=Trueperella sp. TaxID=2699835 RepID=UPI0037361390
MIRVALVDDEVLVRSALATLLGLNEELDVVAEFSSGEDAVARLAAEPVDVAILDLQMPGMDGIETAQKLMANGGAKATMILTSHARPGYLKKALESGTRGFLPKNVRAEDLNRAIRDVHAGKRAIDPTLAADTIAAGDSPLTARESDVLELAALGLPVYDIAKRTHLAEGTVRNYLSNIQTKLGARSKHEAAEIARRNGWIG